jgi:hydroxymethylpyrimidine pyrophosphatase-like HAD family hydrolase
MSVSATHATANKEREVSSTRTPATVRLLVADVDGTLVTHEKVLTERARAAVAKMRSAGIQFAITSGRPPRGMEMLIAPLALTTPIAAFNGGMFVKPDLSVIEQRVLQADVIEPAMETMRKHGLDSWIYRGTEWFVRDRHGPHVDREEWTVKFPPTVVSNFEGLTNDVAKLVGVSDDLEAVHECETAVREQFAAKVHTRQTNPQRETFVSAASSQPYYLDVTHP